MKEQRRNPEELLDLITKEETREKRGKLKIYLGAAPGVGKTYSMLTDAHAKRKQGLDVVVGIVESHGRKEIESLLEGLDVIPRQVVNYRNNKLYEFDLDAALKRNPALILMDEMAHTNAPELRHAKRWQDIKEILDRGIDVYTTLNVQHVESLKDIASQIIHIPIKETVPDFMIEMADTIEVIDLPPEDLLKRLQEGKVYFPQQAELAAENFFRKGNLSALRELALRVTAERVNAQVLLYRQGKGIKHIWPTKDKLLVCVGHRASSAKIIRAARRLASTLQAEWIAVHVNTPNLPLTDEEHNLAIQNLRLAEQLGAETKILTGSDVVAEIIYFAREQNITKIVLQKRLRPRWKEIFRKSLADELIRNSGEIDIYIITGEGTEPKHYKTHKVLQTSSWKTYIASLIIVGVSTIIALILAPYFYPSNLIMIYLLGCTFVALLGEKGPTILATTLSVVLCDLFFIPPYYSFWIADIHHGLTLIVLIILTQIISNLTIQTKRQAKVASLVEQRTSTLHSLSKQLASTRGMDKILEIAVVYIGEVFDSDVLALLPEHNNLAIHAKYKTTSSLSAKEWGVAQWVFDLGQMAGLGTDTLPFSDSIYVPLLASKGSIGVLRIHPLHSKQLFTPEQMHLLEACANQIAIALEVDRLHDQTKSSELQVATTEVRNSLLQSVSHDLRTPLVAVMGAASTLMEMGNELSPKNVKQLGSNIYFELEQLSRLINNLLQISYLEAGSVNLQKEPLSLKELILLVINASNKKLGKKIVRILIPDDLPMIQGDKTLLEEVFFNLLDNAIKFTAPETPIEISVKAEKDEVIVCVEDHGPGIVPDEVNNLFEKFYRGRKLTSERGLGLGLAICKEVVNAHGGEIWAANRTDGGAAFYFTLPITK